MYVHDTESGERMLLANLNKGSSFNFSNSFLGRPSLFDFEAVSDVDLLVLTQEDVEDIASHSEEV